MTATCQQTDRNWIQTASGKQFWPLQPRTHDVCITDIAHALSNKCRFTGHVKEFYSVAQHSVLCSYIVPSEHALEALMHDATEAYLPDVARPVKHQLADFKSIEDRLHVCIAKALGYPAEIPDCVHHADIVLLVTERRDLMQSGDVEWSWFNDICPLDEVIIPWSPSHSKAAFLRRFHQLRDTPLLFLQTIGLVPRL